MAEKLRRYAIAAGVLFLLICLASLIQHWDYLAAAFSTGIWNLVSGIVVALLPLLIVLWILRLFFGGWRK